MSTGTVKFYNDQKGYGFIAPDGGGNDVFVHATALERAGMSSLREGQKVSFETEVYCRSGNRAEQNPPRIIRLKRSVRLHPLAEDVNGAQLRPGIG